MGTMKNERENPWYVLMIVFGEPKFATGDITDLVRKNAEAWNAWALRGFSNERIAQLTDSVDVVIPEHPFAYYENSIRASLIHRANTRIIPSSDSEIKINNCVIHNDILIRGMYFPSKLEMKDGLIEKGMTFSNCLFGGGVDMSKTKSIKLIFWDSKINGNAIFSQMILYGPFQFQRCSVSGGMNCIESGYMGGFWLNDTVIGIGLSLVRSKFHFIVTAKHCRIEKDILISGAVFKKHPVDIINTSFLGTMKIEGATWPPAPGSPEVAETSLRSYHALRSKMNDMKLFWEEHFFMRKEFECRKFQATYGTSGVYKFINEVPFRIFDISSGYGWRIDRPAALLVVTWCVGASLIFCLEWADFWLGGWETTGRQAEYFTPLQSLGLSISNTVSFLGINSHIMKEEIASLTGISEFISAIQMFIGPILIFLIGLGFRNRFKIR